MVPDHGSLVVSRLYPLLGLGWSSSQVLLSWAEGKGVVLHSKNRGSAIIDILFPPECDTGDPGQPAGVQYSVIQALVWKAGVGALGHPSFPHSSPAAESMHRVRSIKVSRQVGSQTSSLGGDQPFP